MMRWAGSCLAAFAAAAFSPDASAAEEIERVRAPLFVGVQFNARFSLIDISTGETSPGFVVPPQGLQAAAYLPDGTLLVARNGGVFRFDVGSGAVDPYFDLALDIRGIAIDSAGRIYLSVSDGFPHHSLRAIDPDTGVVSKIGDFFGANTIVQGLAFSPAGELFAVAPDLDFVEGGYGLYKLDRNTAELDQIGGFSAPVTSGPSQSIVFTPDGRLSALGENIVAELDPDTGGILGDPLLLPGVWRGIELAFPIKDVSISISLAGKRPTRTSSRVVPAVVALFGSADFDASEVDSGTLGLGPLHVPPNPNRNRLADLNRDGFADLQLRFLLTSDDLGEGQELCLTGIDQAGQAFVGCSELINS